jgi:hypothetical protein
MRGSAGMAARMMRAFMLMALALIVCVPVVLFFEISKAVLGSGATTIIGLLAIFGLIMSATK